MARAPTRRRKVFFVGAGFSAIAHLPNTAALLTDIHELARTHVAWGVSKKLIARLDLAYDFFYPDNGPGFRPNVVDFLASCSSYEQIDKGGLSGGFPDQGRCSGPPLRDRSCNLRRDAQIDRHHLFSASHPLLDDMVQPGNVVI